MRRWYLTDGKIGEPVGDYPIYQLAIDVFQCNPAELREWDVYDLSRVQLILQARAEAREEVARREREK